MLKVHNLTMSNIELEEEDIHTECDKIVVTDKAIFLIEVKNAKQNMLVTEEGNYVTEAGAIVENLGEKINTKEYLLRMALKEWSLENNKEIRVVPLVVSANSLYTLSDSYKYFTSCYCSTLPHLIDDYEKESIYSQTDMYVIKHEIKKKGVVKEYECNFDFNKFRYDFADLLALVETSQSVDVQKRQVINNNQMKSNITEKQREKFDIRRIVSKFLRAS